MFNVSIYIHSLDWDLNDYSPETEAAILFIQLNPWIKDETGEPKMRSHKAALSCIGNPQQMRFMDIMKHFLPVIGYILLYFWTSKTWMSLHFIYI